jgi:hypothetical protein
MSEQKVEVIKIDGDNDGNAQSQTSITNVLPRQSSVPALFKTNDEESKTNMNSDTITNKESTNPETSDSSSSDNTSDSSSDNTSDSSSDSEFSNNDESESENDITSDSSDSISLKSDSSGNSTQEGGDKDEISDDDTSLCATSEILKSKPYYFLLLSRFFETTRLKDQKMEEKNITDVLYDICGHLEDISVNLKTLVSKKYKK